MYGGDSRDPIGRKALSSWNHSLTPMPASGLMLEQGPGIAYREQLAQLFRVCMGSCASATVRGVP